MSEVIAVANQKGGVGKTTTAVNLGIGLVRKGYRVLLIDADPQGSLSVSLGFAEPDALGITLATLMLRSINEEDTQVREGILHHMEFLYNAPTTMTGYYQAWVNRDNAKFNVTNG